MQTGTYRPLLLNRTAVTKALATVRPLIGVALGDNSKMDQPQAEQFIVEFIRERPSVDEIYLSAVVELYVYTHEQEIVRTRGLEARRPELGATFFDAAWDLALLGVLRPGNPTWPVVDKFDGTKYAVTAFGRRWVAEGTEETFVPIGSETFVDLLRPYVEYGEPFLERAREAARCWKVRAYLACCVMCGAAAESILVAAASAKSRDEAQILSAYNSKGGRRKLELFLASQARTEIKDALSPLFGLVKYWRDEASHGAASGITQAAARTSLQALFLYARFVHRNWTEIIKPAAAA